MKRDLDQPMMTLDNKPFDDKATLKTVIFMVLNAPVEGDDKMGVDQKMRQFGLLKTVHGGGVVELSAEDISMIKARAAKVMPVMHFGLMCDLLETEYVEKPKADAGSMAEAAT